MPALLGIDIGTTSTIGILIDTEGRTLATASRPADLLSPEASWAEEDPAQWWSNTRAVIAELLGETGLAGADIAAIGTTGMVPALVLLGAEGRVLRRSMQQNDARALAEIDEMGRRVDPAGFLAATGGSVNQQIAAPKLRWLQRHEPEVFARIATIFGSYDYITYRLSGARSVDHNWALESGLMDIGRREFTPALLAEAGIAPALLPPNFSTRSPCRAAPATKAEAT